MNLCPGSGHNWWAHDPTVVDGMWRLCPVCNQLVLVIQGRLRKHEQKGDESAKR